MAQELYVVIEFDRETHEFSEIETIYRSKEKAENLVEEYNAKFLRYSYEWFEETYHDEEVDAVLAEKDAEIRRLKRALWLERARRASAWQIHFALSHNHSIKREFTINGASSPHDRMVTMRTARDWAMIWENVERKCRAKAEEYK